jgi:hypothetical protein
MSTKQAIEDAALKAGKAVREALEEFNKETGMQAHIDARWMSWTFVEQPTNQSKLLNVTLNIGGLEVVV